MDFALTDDQQAIRTLAAQILGDGVTPERLRALERGSGPRFDAGLWRDLAAAGLVGVGIGSAHGGTGLGFLEVAIVLQEIGRRTAPVPFFETAVLAGLAIEHFGTDAQRAAWLPSLASGDRMWTAALGTLGGDAGERPIRATRVRDGWRLDVALHLLGCHDAAADDRHDHRFSGQEKSALGTENRRRSSCCRLIT